MRTNVSIPIDYGSRCGSYSFFQWLSISNNKQVFLLITPYCTVNTFTSAFKDSKSIRGHKWQNCRNQVFLNFSLVDGKIRIGIRQETGLDPDPDTGYSTAPPWDWGRPCRHTAPPLQPAPSSPSASTTVETRNQSWGSFQIQIGLSVLIPEPYPDQDLILKEKLIAD
jgi:hypothetical protein